jgi:hypothetical protein
MARICAACRLPVDDPREHDCPEDQPRDDGEDGPEAA